MTYIVGMKNAGVVAIICDSRATFAHARNAGMTYSLKSGSFFPGCVYAAAGWSGPMRRFVVRCKERLSGHDTLARFWDKFQRFADGYEDFEPDQPFHLLLTSRHTGEPTLYLFNSADKSIEEPGDFVTLGSGKTILDPVLKNLYADWNEKLLQHLRETDVPLYFFAYYYCLWLLELTQGFEYQQLEEAGVGGFFHFSYQTSDTEHRQDPAVYVIVNAFVEPKIITYTLYRITFEQMALVVENGAARSFSISIDEAVWPKIRDLDRRKRKRLRGQLMRGALKQPFYNFCGFGFADPKYREMGISHINYGSDPYVLDRKSLRDERVTGLIQKVITGELKVDILRTLKD